MPSDRRAVLDLTLTGTAKTQTVGVTGPVRVYTTAATRFAGRKRIATDAERLELSPAVVRVRQDTELTNVGTQFAGPLDRVVSGVAARSFYRDQDETNQESAQITERSIAASRPGSESILNRYTKRWRARSGALMAGRCSSDMPKPDHDIAIPRSLPE